MTIAATAPTTPERDASAEWEGTPASGPRRSRRRWVFHALALGALLFAILAIARPTQIVSADEGALLSEVRTLVETGRWTLPIHRAIDPDGAWFGLHQPTIVADGAIAFDRPPTYPLLVAPFWEAGGLIGVLALHVLGVWLAAVLAGRLTERLRPGRGIAAMWLTGALSPMLFDGYWAIAHSLVAAGATAAVLGAIRYALDARRSGLVHWAAGLVAAVGLRTEPLFIAAGLMAALAFTGCTQRGSARWRAWALAAGTGAITGAVFFGVRAWQAAIEGAGGASLPSPSNAGGYLAARLGGFRHSVVGPGFEGRAGALVVLFAAACTATAVVMARLDRGDPKLHVTLAWAGAAAAVLRAAMSPDLITGLVMAAPLVVAAACCLPKSLRRDPSTRIVAIAAVVTVVAVIATQHERGGTGEWGGRYFHVALPLLCVLAVVSLDWLAAHRPAGRSVVAAGLVGCVALSVLSLRTAADARDVVEVRTERTWRAAERTADAAHPAGPVVVSTWIAGGRFAWRHVDAARYLTVPNDRVGALAHRLAAAHVTEWVLLAQPEDAAHLHDLAGYRVIRREPFGSLGWAVLTFRSVAPSTRPTN